MVIGCFMQGASRLAAAFMLIAASSMTASAESILCLEPLSQNAVVDVMSGAPPSEVGKPLPDYTVRIDSGDVIPIDDLLTTPIKIAPRDRHLVSIYADGRLDTSFYLRFSDYGSSILSLGKGEYGYQTWMVTPVKKCR